MPIATPYKFSDWYGYDKDQIFTTSFECSPIPEPPSPIGSGASGACADETRTTRYFSPSVAGQSRPIAGNNVWYNSNGTSALPAGFFSYDNPNQSFRVDSNGVVMTNSVQNC